MRIITGSTGEAHVTANDDGELNIGIFGDGLVVLPNGYQLEATVTGSNTIAIKDGDVVFQGRHALIAPGTTETVLIATGTSGKKRIDYICVHYEVDSETGYEDISLVVKTGTAASSSPSAPSYTVGNIRTGSPVAEYPLYRVYLDGVSISSITYMCGVFKNLGETYKAASGAISLTIEDGARYELTNVSTLALTGADVDASGFITFGPSTPTVTLSGFAATAGNDITRASAGSVWEFDCKHGYCIFKEWDT